MTTYVADHETGAPLCGDCAATADHTLPCEARWCQCWCRVEAGLAEARDDRPDAALTSIARDLEAEQRPAVLDLHAERYGDHRTLTAERIRRGRP